MLDIPYHPGHGRSSSHGSVYSFDSSPESLVTVSTRHTTPARSPVRTHGPLLLPKIRSQDQALGPAAATSPPKRTKTSPARTFRPTHVRSFTSPEAIIAFPPAPLGFSSQLSDDSGSAGPALLCSPVSFAPADMADGGGAGAGPSGHSRRSSSCSLDNVTIEKYGFPTYRGMPAYLSAPPPPPPVSAPSAHLSQPDSFLYQPYAPRAPSPLAAAASVTPEPPPSTTLLTYLTSPNPAPALVRTISFRSATPTPSTSGGTCARCAPGPPSPRPPSSLCPAPPASCRAPCRPLSSPRPHPASATRRPESALHAIYASHYVPKLNAALALSSPRPLQLSVPHAKAPHGGAECMFMANAAGESTTAAAIFGGKPTARVVGLVRSFDRFNTGMRAEGNVKRVEYLRGLAHLHHAMREHSCRYGFILTEIELVVVRNGGDATPHFGYLEVAAIQLATAPADGGDSDGAHRSASPSTPLTACLALWGLCMLAGDEPLPANAYWRSEIGAPAEGTRRKALPRDDWMPPAPAR